MPRSLGPSSVTSRPSMRIFPPLGSSSPAMSRSSVDLPQPDGPTRTRNSPSATLSERLGMTVAAPKRFARFSISRVAMGSALHRPREEPVHEGPLDQDIEKDKRQRD